METIDYQRDKCLPIAFTFSNVIIISYTLCLWCMQLTLTSMRELSYKTRSTSKKSSWIQSGSSCYACILQKLWYIPQLFFIISDKSMSFAVLVAHIASSTEIIIITLTTLPSDPQ